MKISHLTFFFSREKSESPCIVNIRFIVPGSLFLMYFKSFLFREQMNEEVDVFQ